MAGIVCVMLIAVSNISNLLLVRAVEREREVAIQRALGASRARVFSSVLVEGIVLALVGGGVEAFPIRHVVVRIELGDRLTNYPGPTIDASGEAHSMAFWSNEFRLVAGAGVRF